MKQFRRVRDFTTLTLNGLDGEVGTVQDLYFDDHNWAVRYLVVRTGGWLLGRDVLIAPVAVDGIDDTTASMRIHLHKEQIEQAPSIESAAPISRLYEDAYYKHFRWVPYWQPDSSMWGSPNPYLGASVESLDQPTVPEPPESTHLRSSSEITGYGIHAMDGEIGHLDDLVVDDEDWVVRYVEVDTRNWLPGKKVLVQTGRIQGIDWTSRSVKMSLTRQAIESAPPYDPSMLITPDYEVRLFTHYGKHAA
jgi:sporulation protein YlmC with PRC-barrel domain